MHLCDGYAAAVSRELAAGGEGVDDEADVSLAQPVLISVFHKAFGSIHHEDVFALFCPFLVEDDDACRDTCPIEEVGRQSDNAFDESALDKLRADVLLCVASEQDPVRQDDGSLSVCLERCEDVKQEGVVAIFLWRHSKARKPTELVVFWVNAIGPVLGRKRRVGYDIVEFF